MVEQLPDDDNDVNSGLPNFSATNVEARREIDTMLRIMLDSAPNDSASLPSGKRPKFLSNHLTLSSERLDYFVFILIIINLFFSDSLYSAEITEAAARSNLPSIGQRFPPVIPQYPSIGATPTVTNNQSSILSPLTPNNARFHSNTSKSN